MKILQLCRKFPYPLKDGESIAVTYLAKAYAELEIELTLLSFNTIKHYFDLKTLPPSFNHYKSIHASYLNNRPRLLAAFLNLFSKKSYHISRFTTDDFADQLTQLLQKTDYEVVQLESVYLAPYLPIIRQYSKALVVMRAHNVEFEIWQRIAENTTFLPKKYYLSYLSKKLKRYEIGQLNNYDLFLAMTQRDLDIFKKFGHRGAALVIPIGLQLTDYQIANQKLFSDKQSLSISFIGSLDWMPNQEGLSWFLESVWGELRRIYPHLELHIAGRNTPKWIFEKAGKGITIHGEVTDAKAFLAKYPITLVPLFSGSGMRVKILEGMAMGRVVLSTTLGLEGIPASDKKEVLIADTKTAFIQAIRFCHENLDQLNAISQKAKAFVRSNYNNLKIAKKAIKKMQLLSKESNRISYQK